MVFRGRCSPPLEGLPDSLLQHIRIDVVIFEEVIQVVKVFHSSVYFGQINHSLEFFGNRGFDGIGEKYGCVHFQDDRISHFDWSGYHHITKTDVDL